MKILIVDDSKAMRMIVSRTLKQTDIGNFTVIEAGSGVEALEKLESESPDLILSDWNMPEMKGIELLQKVREAGNNIRFGFITSESSAETRKQATEAGAAFLVTKPFTADSIQAALEPILS
ncbi:response regulator [Stieleria sp. JC731]|uniref:response regulator n=1 Tax=Pirellulaceae TaxID=2691357 RepID=UPI001E5C30EF|nr:response regulator [Stieleria sp. JC731]MCC9600507.1 response regulator [Stieleria sp. JC731]